METVVYSSGPIGSILLQGSDTAISRVELLGRKKPKVFDHKPRASSPLGQALRWLDAYFAGRKPEPFPLSLLDLSLGTEFQKKVWETLWKIPYGVTENYRGIAVKIGSHKAARAIGMANSRNRIPLLIPCHRVIAADGSLGGFTPDLSIKRRLLAIEGVFTS